MKRITIIILSILLIGIIGGGIYVKRLITPQPLTYQMTEAIETTVDTEQTMDYNENRNAYFGDLHIHTSWSFDAFIYNVRGTPDDAYRFGKGEKIGHVSGDSVQLNRPLDFMAVTDHSEYMGVMMQMSDDENPLSKLEVAKKINSTDSKISKKAFGQLGFSIAVNKPMKDLTRQDILTNTWQKAVAIADQHYAPGEFTTFAAYEWTSSVGRFFAKPQYAENQHRNVIFKGGKVTGVPFSSFNSQNPEDLWTWMEQQRKDGIEVLAIPHNANISDGKMYGTRTFKGNPMDKDYVEKRLRNEPVSEVVQIKGQSMAHPALSPNDEFADFEVYESMLGRGDVRHQSQAKGGYVRDALKDGLMIEEKVGGNPYKFGFIGSSDSHNATSNHEEHNNVGKSGFQDVDARKRLEDSPAAEHHRNTLVAGLAGVWAKENTRSAIFEALQRKEVFATSGTRIKVRFFASWENFTDSIFEQKDWLTTVYANAVPMGNDLPQTTENGTPIFIIKAIKDAEGANLDRVQIVKGWLDKNGETQEKVFDIVWSGDRKLSADGALPKVGNTVNVKNATYTNEIGAITLQKTWIDPEFDAKRPAFYYLRVLEIPTPRWTTYDAAELGVTPPEANPTSIQERAWSSPIWYSPIKN